MKNDLSMQIHRDLITLARKQRWLLSVCVLNGFLVGLAVIFQASLISQIVTRVFLQHQTLELLSGSFKALILVVFLRAGFVGFQNLATSRLAMEIKHFLRMSLYRHLLDLSPVQLAGEKSGEIDLAAIESIEGLDAYYSQFLPQLVLAALVPLSIAGSIFPRDVLSAGILLLTAPLLPVFMILIGSLAEKVTHRQWELLHRLSAAYLDTIQGLATLKFLNQSIQRGKDLEKINEDYRLTTLKVLRTTFLSAFVLEFISTISIAIVAVEIGIKLLYGQMGYATALFILILAPEFYLPLRTLGLRFHAAMSGSAAAEKIFRLLDLQPEVPPVVSPARRKIEGFFPIRFEQVFYQYNPSEKPILNGMNLDLREGEHLSLLGSSGSGKSTIVQLLMQFLKPTSGQISAGGIPLWEISRPDWLKQVAWVPQAPYLFTGTFRENLLIAKPGATQTEFDQAVKMAGLEEFLHSLESGSDTPIGEGGTRLSSGQAQRLAVARAFLKDSPLLILDEPTAYLDPETEEDLTAILGQLMRARTVLMIAHRLATVASADRIAVLENGQIIEEGVYGDLARAGGNFSRLLKAGGYAG